jgi:hypothetical protein
MWESRPFSTLWATSAYYRGGGAELMEQEHFDLRQIRDRKKGVNVCNVTIVFSDTKFDNVGH